MVGCVWEGEIKRKKGGGGKKRKGGKRREEKGERKKKAWENERKFHIHIYRISSIRTRAFY